MNCVVILIFVRSVGGWLFGSKVINKRVAKCYINKQMSWSYLSSCCCQFNLMSQVLIVVCSMGFCNDSFTPIKSRFWFSFIR
jgi:hypothetical protein